LGIVTLPVRLYAGNRIGHSVLPVDDDGCRKIGGPDCGGAEIRGGL
jgi:hypothetical protein